MDTEPKFTNVHARRLLKLADFLDALPPRRFKYSTWVGEDWKGKQDLSCGTVACALGWAATMPAFRRLGLRLHAFADDLTSGEVRLGDRGDDTDASREIFGLTQWEHLHLFAAEPLYDEHNTGEILRSDISIRSSAKSVAKHIRRFVKWKRERESHSSSPAGGDRG